jgi:hypothetical protein
MKPAKSTISRLVNLRVRTADRIRLKAFAIADFSDKEKFIMQAKIIL